MNEEEQLQALFAAYREACQAPEPGPAFMPGLWGRIEARRSPAWLLRRFAGGLVTLAAVFCLTVAAFTIEPFGNHSLFYTGTYIDALDDAGSEEPLALLEVEPRPDGLPTR